MKQEEKRALPEANEAFATNLLNRAATIIEQQAEADNRNANAFEAIHQAPDIKLTFNFDYLDQEVLEGDDVYDSDYTDFSGNSWLPITIPLDERNQVEEGGGFVLESIRVDATDVEVKPLKIGDAVRGSATEVFHFFKDLYHDDVFEYTTFTLNINCTQQSDGTGTCDDPPGGGGASGEDDENDQ